MGGRLMTVYDEAQLALSHAVEACQKLPKGQMNIEEAHLLQLYTMQANDAISKATVVCECGHVLGSHPPDPRRPFAWPCRACSCSEYKEVTQ